jgi:hypothetical protein
MYSPLPAHFRVGFEDDCVLLGGPRTLPDVGVEVVVPAVRVRQAGLP